MYAQTHVVHWTQAYDKEEGLGLYTKINSCTAMFNVSIIATITNLNKYTPFDLKK